MVLAAEEQQGLPIATLGALHLADVDGVVAGVVRRDDPAFDMRQSAVEDRGTGAAVPAGQVHELVAARDGEVPRHLLLPVGQDVHDEGLGEAEGGMALGPLVDADEDERRIERHGADRS